MLLVVELDSVPEILVSSFDLSTIYWPLLNAASCWARFKIPEHLDVFLCCIEKLLVTAQCS